MSVVRKCRVCSLLLLVEKSERHPICSWCAFNPPPKP